MTPSLLERFWADAEAGRALPPGASGAERVLREVHDAEMAIQLDVCRAKLEQARREELDAPFGRVRELLDLRVRIRAAKAEELGDAAPRLRALLASCTASEEATVARVWHTLAVLSLRVNDADTAEESLANALALVGDAPARIWILDSWAQHLMAIGAWHEARRTLLKVLGLRSAAEDARGVAITGGHLARLEMALGDAPAAKVILVPILARWGEALEPLSRLRLQTGVVDACLAASDPELPAAASALEAAMGGACSGHYLEGYAAMALAKAAARRGDAAGAQRWFRVADANIGLPDQRALLRFAEAQVTPSLLDDAAWLANVRTLFADAGHVTLAEVEIGALLATRAKDAGNAEAARQHLDGAYRAATTANNAAWFVRLDAVGSAVDPEGTTNRVLRRYSGRSFEEVHATVREDVTIIFADLVSFTPRVLELPPDEVMETVRSLFEIAASLLVKHHVRPLTCMGDGLLAVAQGPQHEARGLAFARDYVRRAARISVLRRTFGDVWGLDLRAGCASGLVVMGAIGSHLKLEFAAIGLTTNLASRLQSAAEPGQVVAAERTAADVRAEGVREMLTLKGFKDPVAAVRFAVATVHE